MMRKLFSLLLLCILLFTSLPVFGGAVSGNAPMENATDRQEVFTLTVILLDLETRRNDSPLLTVKLSEEETAVLETAGYCRFLDNRERVLSPSDFGKRYKEKEVTIDFVEHGPDLYSVIECRGGRQ